MPSLDQYRAARQAAGFIDRSARGKIAVTGADRATYLQGLLTNDIAALHPGTGCYAAYLTPQGRMIADLHVLELGDMMLLDVHPDVKDRVLARLEEFVILEDVQLADRTEVLALLSLHGPHAAASLARALAGASGEGTISADQLARFADHQNVRVPFRGSSAIIARNDQVGLPGFDIYAERGSAGVLREALLSTGPVELDGETFEILRVEAGRPAFYVDMDEDTIPLEAGIEDRAISFTKGCYVGQEVIIRILHRGHGRVARRLVGLTVAGGPGEVPARDDAVFAGDKEVGRVTSAVFSPGLDRPVALSYVHRDLAVPGASVEVEHGGRRLRATVTVLPFVPAA